ncbi:LysR family transcriptional regulator [Massilia sp. TWP1-3-3]|uniref:LysR family transcriptional regulator n=1 Tax=Massilia sp. TWP1-3-3 TaxID=2804573 RepID=UPI003CEF2F07
MNLTDLRIFVSAALRPSLGAAAVDMHLTPSAVSKALRRLEASLDTPLFDRTAKQLVLNDSGQRLLARARALLALADQAKSDVMGERAALACRLGGPALLLWRHGQGAAEALRTWPDATLSLQAMFEDEALAALARGDINGAIVTGEAIAARGAEWRAGWEATPLGELNLQLVAGKTHPLARRKKGGVVEASSAQVLEHDFACPPRSLFCGVQRGARSDGWRDDQLPRRIRYWTDDLQLLLGFVRSGSALAYLPDFALVEADLVRIHVTDCAFRCTEQAFLVWDSASGAQWQHVLARTLASPA